MTDETGKQLRQARSLLKRCAEKISSRKTNTNWLSDVDREMLIGFGTAHDWIRWAVSLRDLQFQRSEERSERKAGITEWVRFNQIWTATNALFAKESILSLIPSFQSMTNAQRKNISRSDGKQFEQIYKFASVNQNLATDCLVKLNNLLSMRCEAQGVEGIFEEKRHAYPMPAYPMPKLKPLPTMWEVIFHKYLTPTDQTRGLGKEIMMALQAQKMPRVDGPTLIYATRNWAVHGVLLTSFFRGSRQKFMIYIDNITLLLSAVVRGSADKFLQIL
jgi:hypothetical protein